MTNFTLIELYFWLYINFIQKIVVLLKTTGFPKNMFLFIITNILAPLVSLVNNEKENFSVIYVFSHCFFLSGGNLREISRAKNPGKIMPGLIVGSLSRIRACDHGDILVPLLPFICPITSLINAVFHVFLFFFLFNSYATNNMKF